MKLTTLNLQGFIDWEQREQEVIDYLSEVDSDVVMFEEVTFIDEISQYNQAQLLNQQLNYRYENSVVTRLQASPHYETYREGLSTLSKYAIKKSDTLILKQAPGDEHNRIIQLIDIEIGERVVKLANVHFSITDVTDFATAHLEETLAILEARGEERIIAGDFNMSELETRKDLWGDKYRASSEVAYISYPPMNKCVDYVLVPNSYSFADISTSGDGLSDHRAVTVEIELEQESM